MISRMLSVVLLCLVLILLAVACIGAGAMAISSISLAITSLVEGRIIITGYSVALAGLFIFGLVVSIRLMRRTVKRLARLVQEKGRGSAVQT